MRDQIKSYYKQEVDIVKIPEFPKLKKKKGFKPIESILMVACALLLLFTIYIPQPNHSRQGKIVFTEEHITRLKESSTAVLTSYMNYLQKKESNND